MRAKLIFSVTVALLLFAGGMALAERRGDSAATVALFESQLESAFAPKQIPTPTNLEGRFRDIVQTTPAWTEVERLATGLTWSNRQVAEARALLRYENRPGLVYAFQWDDRFVTAERPWQVEEPGAFQTRRVETATAAGAFGFCATFAVLVGCSWLWGASLRRVRELSNAFRGKE